MTKEEELFQRHLLDLGNMAWQRNIAVFSDFLNLNQQNIYHDTLPSLPYVQSRAYGGYEHAERQMIAFIPDALSLDVCEFPITCLKISPLNRKFSEELNHRDYLGSLMNLGIDRSKTGDIVIQEREAYLFCNLKIAGFLTSELTRIRHTTVSCQLCSDNNIHYHPKLQELTGTVASVRLDALLSLAFGASRSSLIGLIVGGKTFVNGRLITSNGYHPQEYDIISVRGYGRFQYCGVLSSTKKGRYLVKIQKYL